MQSGNFDDPPASDSYRETADRIVREILDNTQSPDDISPSGELYRAIERFHRRRGTERQSSSQSPNFHAMASEQDPDRRRRLQREAQDASPLFVLPPQPPSAEPSARERAESRLAGMTARRGRPRMSVSDRYMRHRAV